MLISREGVLSITDFGLARIYGSPERFYTHQVVTLWYRAPELLFGARKYTGAIDMWAVGCIFAELMLRTPYFPGTSDLDQLGKIFAALGTPTEETWPGVTALPDYVEFQSFQATPFSQLFTAATNDTLDLLASMLKFCPARRCSAQQALDHEYFTANPPPTPPVQLPRIPEQRDDVDKEPNAKRARIQ